MLCFSFYIHKRLFRQIRSHSPFRYQDELMMCLSAEDKCAKSDSTLPISKRMPSVRQTRLSQMYSHKVLCADKELQIHAGVLLKAYPKHYRDTAPLLTRPYSEICFYVYVNAKN